MQGEEQEVATEELLSEPIVVPPNDVTVETITPGDGERFPRKGDTLTMHYTGTLTNGHKFDCSRDRGATAVPLSLACRCALASHIDGGCTGIPLVFGIGVGEVIEGWDKGVMAMSVGQRARLLISSNYAYGAAGDAPVP